MLRLGLFENFKSEAKMVVCSGNREDMAHLLSLVTRVHSGVQDSVPLHDEVVVAPNHPTKLFLAQSLPPRQATNEFSLLFSDDVGREIHEKITSLKGVVHGHQYFELAGNKGTLMISVDEYDDEWWTNHG